VYSFPALELYACFALTEAFFLVVPERKGIAERLEFQKHKGTTNNGTAECNNFLINGESTMRVAISLQATRKGVKEPRVGCEPRGASETGGTGLPKNSGS
jgi:hypothetical protein